MQSTFKSLEHQGWNERARFYDDYTARLTSFAIGPLLDAAEVRRGARVLDVCCGTGTAAAEAARRGATVTGIDLSEDMIRTAQAKALAVDFQIGDAEAVPFPDRSFDCVICNFGILHLPDPERGIAEAARVLRPGGKLALAVWSHAASNPFHYVLADILERYVASPPQEPDAPDAFRFAAPGKLLDVARAAGLADARERLLAFSIAAIVYLAVPPQTLPAGLPGHFSTQKAALAVRSTTTVPTTTSTTLSPLQHLENTAEYNKYSEAQKAQYWAWIKAVGDYQASEQRAAEILARPPEPASRRFDYALVAAVLAAGFLAGAWFFSEARSRTLWGG